MNKKPYEAPIVKKVRLEVRNAVLAICYSSTNSSPKNDPFPCNAAQHCYNKV
jgi:hypothetical protein